MKYFPEVLIMESILRIGNLFTLLFLFPVKRRQNIRPLKELMLMKLNLELLEKQENSLVNMRM
jgi:hypothetical protein